MSYHFEAGRITQHVVKYGVDLRPVITADRGLSQMRDYGDWLIQEFPEAFETMLSGRQQLRVQRTFALPNAGRVEMHTFTLTHRGPVFTFPRRLYIGRSVDMPVQRSDEIFLRAFKELRVRFADHAVPRVGVIHEMAFDTETADSLQILAENLKKEPWRSVKNLRILMEASDETRNINIGIWPTQSRRDGQRQGADSGEQQQFAIMVNVDINNRQVTQNLGEVELNELLDFASDYVPGRLIGFLNGQ